MSQKQIKDPKRYTFLAKGALISMLALGVGTGSVFASGAVAPAPSPTATTEVSTEVSVEAAVSESAEKKPGLLPGDFFYFIKVVYENIRLSVTTDDVKEAKLLAEFAQERLSEAAALHAKGDEEKAVQVLQKSFENQQQAIELVDSEADEENEEKDLEQAVKVKSDLQHNIIALTAALEKVKNPQAQQSLLKNIIKSFGHLEKKLAKLESKAQEDQASETSTVQEPVAAVAPADAKTDAIVSSDADVETVVDKKTKPVKEAKIEKKEKKEKKEKIEKEVTIENEVKIELDDQIIKQKNDNKNDRNNNNHNNHNNNNENNHKNK